MTKTYELAAVEEEVLSDGSEVYNVRMCSIGPLSGKYHFAEIAMPTMESAWKLADMINETACDVTVE